MLRYTPSTWDSEVEAARRRRAHRSLWSRPRWSQRTCRSPRCRSPRHPPPCRASCRPPASANSYALFGGTKMDDSARRAVSLFAAASTSRHGTCSVTGCPARLPLHARIRPLASACSAACSALGEGARDGAAQRHPTLHSSAASQLLNTEDLRPFLAQGRAGTRHRA